MFRGTTRARSASCCNLNGSPFTKHVYWALCCNLKGSPFTKQVYWHKQSKQLKIQRMQRQQCKETDMSLHWLHFELHARFVQIYMHRNGWLLTDLADNMADNQGLPPWLTTRDYSPTWLTTWLTTKDYSNHRADNCNQGLLKRPLMQAGWFRYCNNESVPWYEICFHSGISVTRLYASI